MLCHNYIFFDSDPNIHAVPPMELKKEKARFAEVIGRHTKIRTEAYATLGLKVGTRFMLWMQADIVEEIQTMLAELMHTPLGAHLKISYTLFGLVRESQYSKHPPEETKTTERRYLVVYPFTKTKEWHLIGFDERKNMMWDHVKVGKKFSASIEQVLLYAYGVDDHEFIVSYQTDSLPDFQTLVMELRSTEGRRYTENDTPIFTCVRKSVIEALEMI